MLKTSLEERKLTDSSMWDWIWSVASERHY